MQSVACPNQDNGICTVPDPAVVVSTQGVSLLRAELVDDLIETAQDEPQLRPLQGEASYEQLVVDAGEALSRGDEERHERFLAAVGRRKRTVIVNCSCGHVFVMDI
jgi:hypothetical protein